MRARLIVAIVLIAVGVVWIGQGVGIVHGSFMTGQGVWAVIGAVAALFGVALLAGLRRDRKDRPE